jgi:hypothetical protein
MLMEDFMIVNVLIRWNGKDALKMKKMKVSDKHWRGSMKNKQRENYKRHDEAIVQEIARFYGLTTNLTYFQRIDFAAKEITVCYYGNFSDFEKLVEA